MAENATQTDPTPLREGLDFAETDALLRDDVRELGAMVGDTLAGKIDDDSFDEAYENLSEYERLW